MRFNQIISKLQNFNTFIIRPPKCWKRPKKSDVLIYDVSGSELLMQYLSLYSMEFLHIRFESVNVLCLIRAVFSISFWRGQPIQAYTDAYIRFVSPKVIITFIDNDPVFYTISSRFGFAKTVFVQNGTRSEIGDVFGHLEKNPKYHVDYMLVHGEAIGKQYQKFISGITIPTGSLKNNHIKILSDQCIGTVLFISQFRDKPENNAPFMMRSDGVPIDWSWFYAAEVKVLDFLGRWCLKNNKLLKVCARKKGMGGAENQFFSECLKNYNWEYIPQSESYNSYQLIDKSELVVFLDSTLGYESLARGKKTACFACRATYLNIDDTKFGWPAMLPDNGPFWTNDSDENEFQRVMDYLNAVSPKEWEQTRHRYAFSLMELNPGNTKFISLFKDLLGESLEENAAKM